MIIKTNYIPHIFRNKYLKNLGGSYSSTVIGAIMSGGTGSSVVIVDDLETSSKEKALSANMGRVLDEKKLDVSGGTINGNLDIASGLIALNITSPTIKSSAVTSNTISSNNVSASAVTSNTINTTGLTSNTITSSALTSNNITASATTSNTIKSTSLSSNTITSSAATINNVTTSALTSNTITASATTSDSVATDKITSKVYQSGLKGFSIDSLGNAEFGNLNVRGEFNVNTINYNKITSTNGEIWVTDSAQIISIDDSVKVIEVTDSVFRADDYLLCQTFAGSGIKKCIIKIVAALSSTTESTKYTYNNIENSDKLMVGDTLVRMGSSSNPDRDEYIKLSPYNGAIIDVIDNNDVKARVGCLSGITDSTLGMLQGYGLYSDNAYLKGDFNTAKCRLKADGSGYLANQNISWDVNGNVTFGGSVKLNWQNDINNAVTDATTNLNNKIDNVNGELNNKIDDIQDSNNDRFDTLELSATTVASAVTECNDNYYELNNKIGNKLTHIDATGIYTGTIAAEKIVGGYINAEHINADELLSNGEKWALKSDGSGYLASKNISWDTAGNVVFGNSVSLNWQNDINSAVTDATTNLNNKINDATTDLNDKINNLESSSNDRFETLELSATTVSDAVIQCNNSFAELNNKVGNKLTYIDSTGIYTGVLAADQIVAGTINSNLINADELLSNGEKWALKSDGSGYLASKKITWDAEGNLTLQYGTKKQFVQYNIDNYDFNNSFFVDLSNGLNFVFTKNADNDPRTITIPCSQDFIGLEVEMIFDANPGEIRVQCTNNFSLTYNGQDLKYISMAHFPRRLKLVARKYNFSTKGLCSWWVDNAAEFKMSSDGTYVGTFRSI